jgi:hypothetical protein
MTKPAGIGRGGVRPGSGRKTGSRNRTYGELIEDAKREVATGRRSASATRTYLEILAQVRRAQNGRGPMPEAPPALPPKTNGDAVHPALHRLVDDARVDLGQRLRRVEKAGADNGKRLAAMQETRQRVLHHQAAIARQLQVIERTVTPRHTRRRPLGT